MCSVGQCKRRSHMLLCGHLGEGQQLEELLGAARLGEGDQQVRLADDADVAVQRVRGAQEHRLGARGHLRRDTLTPGEPRMQTSSCTPHLQACNSAATWQHGMMRVSVTWP